MADNKHLQYWAALTIFSLVSLASLTNSFDDDVDWVREQKWAVSLTSISLILGVFAYFLSMFQREMFQQEMFAGATFEHAAVILAVAVWCAALPNILNFDSSLAVDMNGFITNVNLFFTSWAAFVAAMVLFAGMIPKLLLGEKGDAVFTPHWLGMGTASFIVMTNAVRFWRDFCDDDKSSAMCKRDKFAFSLGAAGGIFAILFMVFHHEMMERSMSVMFLAAWCFGIAYLTFDDGPAVSSGTFYFATWAAFLFSLNMSVTSFVAFYDKMCPGNGANDDGADAATPGDAANKGTAGQEETDKHDIEEEHEKEETPATA